jgi:hypothetical protein
MGESRAAQMGGGRKTIGQGFRGMGQGFRGYGGFMNRARQAALAKQGGGAFGTRRSPGSKGAIDASGFGGRSRMFGRRGARAGITGTEPKATPPKRTGALGRRSPRSRGLRGRGIGGGMGGTL